MPKRIYKETVSEHQIRSRSIPYCDNVPYRRLDSLSSKEQDETVMDLVCQIFRIWLDLKPRERDIVAMRVLNPGWSVSRIARELKVSRQAIHKAQRKMIERLPVMAEFVKVRS